MVISFFISPSLTAQSQDKDTHNVLDVELEEGEYHNDFSRVGKTEDYINVKPIDLSGDAIIHAKESLDDDLKRIGLVDVGTDKANKDD